MKIWFRRVLSLMLIALGAALIAFNYNNQRSGYTEKEIVYLQIEDYYQPEKIEAQYPGVEIVELIGPEIRQEDFPCIWWAVSDLDEDWKTDTCSVEEWEKLKTAYAEKASISKLVIFHDKLIQTTEQNGKVVFTYLGEYNLHLKELSEDKLAKYSNIETAVSNLNLAAEGENSIPLKEWDKFVSRYLDPMYDSQCFTHKGKVYGPEFGSDVTPIEGPIANLGITFKVIGALLLFLGIITTRKLYFRKRGIMVNPRKIAVLYDVIVLLFAVPSAYLVVSVLLKKFLFIDPVFNEMELTFMGVFFFCFGIPFVSLFTSRFTSQSVEINAKGLVIDSLRTREFISWENIDLIEISEEFVLVGRMGTPLPRKLQKTLKLSDKAGNIFLINEPQLKSVKKKIIHQFEHSMPLDLKEKFEPVLEKW